MAKTNVKSSKAYMASLKSLDTEENIDLMFYRPIGYGWACLAKKCGIGPNAITVASIFLGIGAGVMFYFSDIYLNIIGMILLIWANSFDSADGQLARMTGQYSRIGRILDGLSGDLWFLSIYIAICLREIVTSTFFEQHHWAIWVLALVAGICHTKQAAMADYYRQFHLYFLKGESGSELERAFTLKRKLTTLNWKHDFWQKLSLSFYTNYTLQQEATAPAMQRLRSELADRYPDGKIPVQFREAFRKASLPLMKYTNALTFNWRSIILFVSLFLEMPWIYFACEVTLFNFLLGWMIYRHEKICRYFAMELKEGKFPAE
ncbi:MAG: CDP-alcohol phosphatidyltransferase family protein [Paramuribaculum sp.]|nr:CDP-alcohol phosphatidyltransferase family protein [Paramuribaculum sp.]